MADGGAALLASLPESAAEYLASDLLAKTRRCEAPDCDLLFSQTHPRRRWCSPTVCGNRTRVARYYDRHKN
jgi:predicted RNA-binding Zn ribbon-like protein